MGYGEYRRSMGILKISKKLLTFMDENNIKYCMIDGDEVDPARIIKCLD
jgi:hypothetical protein